MSTANNKTPSDKLLADFLKSQGSADDAFEAEAREGFAALGDQQEASALKSELDARVKTSEIFHDTSSKKPLKYWLAAAGFLLVIGLSVYFMSQAPVDEKNLAISNAPAPDKAETPMPDKVLPDVAPEPAMQDKKSEDKKAASPKGEARQALTSSGAAKPVASPDAIAGNFEAEFKDQPANTVSANTAQTQDEESAAPNAENVAPEKRQNSKPLALKKSVQEQRKEKASSAAPEKSPSIARSDDRDAASAAEPANLYYTGGEAELKKELAEKLTKIDCNRQFEAFVFVDKKGRVKKVELVTADGFSAAEKQKLIPVLESLKNFKFEAEASAPEITKYRILYP